MIFVYNNDFKAYFRFQNMHNKFSKDEFVDREWRYFRNRFEDLTDHIGIDIIPNDVCPSLFEQQEFLKFDKGSGIKKYKLDTVLSQDEYQYMMSMTIMVNETTCTTRNPTWAAKQCNLLKLDEVFMLYFEIPNMAKFHFFSRKNYYESQSKAFFIPYDQWVTIQITFSQYGGYHVVVGDQNGKIIYNRKEVKNMHEMLPSGKMDLLKSFDGYVESFIVSTMEHKLAGKSDNYINDFSGLKAREDDDDDIEGDILFNINFSKDKIVTEGDKTKVLNKGSESDLEIKGAKNYEFVFFEPPYDKSHRGTFEYQGQLFDGIACNDKHMTVKLDKKTSFLRFNTPNLKDWQGENTVEFWFKFEDDNAYNMDALIFSMYDQEGYLPYYHIYVENGDLKCAPFGNIEGVNSAVITFKDFSLANKDQYGWWHISCSYKFQEEAIGVLHNSKVNQEYVSHDLVSSAPNFFPETSLKASFGHSASGGNRFGIPKLLIKEFRYWNKQMSIPELANWRSSQIDPTYLESNELMIYLRLASGSSQLENFAESQPGYTFNETNARMHEFSFTEDFVDEEKYTYDAQLQKVIPQIIRTYHTVCPVHTYFMDQFCFSEPVNTAVLAIFPIWNSVTKALDYEFSLNYSSLIDQAILTFLKPTWETDDIILQDFFDQEDQSKFDMIVPSDLLRHESQYKLRTSLSNEQITFHRQAVVQFVPSKCNWFEVVDSGVRFGKQVLQFTPGGEDISFEIELKTNPELDCRQFMFFDAFDGIDFDYIITNSVDYIDIKPEAVFQAFDKKTGKAITQQDGPTPDTVRVKVTIPADEQKKLPSFQEIMVFMTIRWTNSKYPEMKNLTREATFQNLIYTIEFEPLAYQLMANLVASTDAISRDENLILDASNSYITNLPENMQLKQLAYEWICPQGFEAMCANQNGSQLQITWESVKNEGIVFEVDYEFNVNVIWAKPDGDIQEELLSQTVKWFDLAMPLFSITYEPNPILTTDDSNTVFFLEPINFDINDVRDYEVIWQLTPELEQPEKREIGSSGKVMSVKAQSWSTNTAYSVILTVTNKKLEKLSKTVTIDFQTLAPPRPGTIQVLPFTGFIGSEFTVICREWTSDNPPITYDVYNTYDEDGQKKGLIINQDGPIPIDDEFKYKARFINPVIVVVTDASGETLEYKYAPEIKAEVLPGDNDDGDGGDRADDSVKPKDQPTPQNLLAMIQRTDSTTQKANFMNSAIAQSLIDPHKIDSSSRESEIRSQIEFRMKLLLEIEKEINQFKYDPSGSLDMTMRDFLYETVPMVRDITLIHEYMDLPVVDKARQVIEGLETLDKDMWDIALETDENFRNDYIHSLENINRYAHLNNVPSLHVWTKKQIEVLMDKMCLFTSLAENYSYNSNGQIAFSLYRFDETTALLNRRGTIHVLDAHYDFRAYNMYNWFSTMPGMLCAQVLAMQEEDLYVDSNARRMLQAGTTAYSRGALQVSVYENGTGIRFPMGELSGQTIATFDLYPDTYRSNQTVCMAYSETRKIWDSDLCITELDVATIQQKCTCNAFDSRKVALFTDSSRALGETIDFPEIERDQYQDMYYDFEKVSTTVNEVVSTPIHTLEGAGFVWRTEAIVLSLIFIAGSLIALKFDRNDEKEQSIMKTLPTAVSKQNHFIEEVAKSLGESYTQVAYRQQSLLYYRTIFTKSVFPHIMSQMHPMIAPFTSYIATESRFMRYSMYLLQINIVTILCFIYFGSFYRFNDESRNIDVLDQHDMLQIIGASIVGSILLLPFISEPLVMLCASKIHKTKGQESGLVSVQILPRHEALKRTLIVLSILSTIALPVWAIIQSPNVPASNQYCMTTAVIGSMFGGVLIANLFYMIIISLISKKLKKDTKTEKCLPKKLLQIIKDMKAVNEVKAMFTLADVLPSSLGNTMIDSRAEISQQNALLRVHMLDHGPKTLHTDEEQDGDAVEDIKIIQNADEIYTPKTQNADRLVKDRLVVEPRSGDESQLRSMLKESQLDLDNSRNDIVQDKRTKMDIYASIHPEGYGKLGYDSSLNESSRQFNQSNDDSMAMGPQSQSETIDKGRNPNK